MLECLFSLNNISDLVLNCQMLFVSLFKSFANLKFKTMKTQQEKDQLREVKLNYNKDMRKKDPNFTKRGKKWETIIKFSVSQNPTIRYTYR